MTCGAGNFLALDLIRGWFQTRGNTMPVRLLMSKIS